MSRPDSTPSQPPAWQQSFAARSRPALERLYRLPRWAVLVVIAALLLGGLLLDGPRAALGGLLLLIVAIFVAWLLALAWPALSNAGRALRSLVVVVLVVAVAVKFVA